MEIILKKDWDESLNAPYSFNAEGVGHFVGRKKEIEFLTNDLLRKSSGSILIYGYRGVGKTSLVNQVLWKVREKNSKIIFVPINAPQIEGQYQHTQNQKTLINYLIRRLYTTLTEIPDIQKGLRSKTEQLYIKAVSEDFKTTHKNSLIKNQIQNRSTTVTNDLKGDRRLIIYICMVLTGLLVHFNIIQEVPDFWQKVITFLLFLPLPYAFSYLKKSTRESNRQDTNESASYYAIDNDLANLEHDLEALHTDLKKAERKVVYVIDELDKVNLEFVKKWLDYHKTLFTISKSLFILVGGYNLGGIFRELDGSYYDENEKVKQHVTTDGPTLRTPAYTIFTSKYFIARPSWQELSNYLDDIIETSNANSNDLEVFKMIICFDAKNDFTDLLQQVKDRITYFNEESLNPLIQIKGFSFEDKIKFVLYDQIISFFDPQNELSKWQSNEGYALTSFLYTEKICKAKFGGWYKERGFGQWLQESFPGFTIYKDILGNIIQKLERNEVIFLKEEEIGSEVFGGPGNLVYYVFDESKLDEYLFTKTNVK